MRIIALFGFLAIGLFMPSAAHARTCRVPDRAQLLGRGHGAVVWKVGNEDAWRAVACTEGRQVTIEEGDWMGNDFRLSRLRFAGHWLAYVNDYWVGHYGDGGVRLSTVNLRTGVRTTDLVLMSQVMLDLRPQLRVTSLALTSAGALSWRFSGNVDTAGTIVDFHDGVGAIERAGARILASAKPGSITAFRLRGSTVTWAEDGVTRRASLRGAAHCPLRASCWHAAATSVATS